MPTFFFHSGMAGAPTNTNAAGSTLEIIRSCLVTGFNLKSVVSASVTSEVMTLNFAAPHGYEDKVWLRLDGAAGGSIVQRVTTTAGASTLTIPAPGFADGAVAGTLSTRVAPADWEEVFTGTLKAVFRSKVEGPGSTRFFYRVSDAVLGNTARLRGFESMSDVDTGIGSFPSLAQVAGDGANIVRSSSATVRGWWVVCDSRTVYGGFANDSESNYWTLFFGDQMPFGSTDGFFASVIGATDLSSSSIHYSARAAAGTGTSREAAIRTIFGNNNGRAYPSVIDGGMVLARPVITQDDTNNAVGALRGFMRGLIQCSAQPIPSGKGWLLMISSGIAGRTCVVRTGGPNFNACAFPIDEDWT